VRLEVRELPPPAAPLPLEDRILGVLAAGKPHRTSLLRSLLGVRKKQALLDALRVLAEAGRVRGSWADGFSSRPPGRFPRAYGERHWCSPYANGRV